MNGTWAGYPAGRGPATPANSLHARQCLKYAIGKQGLSTAAPYGHQVPRSANTAKQHGSGKTAYTVEDLKGLAWAGAHHKLRERRLLHPGSPVLHMCAVYGQPGCLSVACRKSGMLRAEMQPQQVQEHKIVEAPSSSSCCAVCKLLVPSSALEPRRRRVQARPIGAVRPRRR